MPVANLKLGFVPGDRPVFSTAWALQMRDRCVKTLRGIAGVELVLPDESISTKGLVRSMEQAEAVAEQFRLAGVNRLLLGTMNFGDEEALCEVARRLRVPVLLLGTPDAVLNNGKRAGSDSFCGTLSVSMNLHTAGIPFTFAGILEPESEAFRDSVTRFIGASESALRAGFSESFDRRMNPPPVSASMSAIARKAADEFRGARLGQFGPRARGFTTCAFDERQLLRQYGQRVVPIDLALVFGNANRLADTAPEVATAAKKIMGGATSEVAPPVIVKMAKLYVSLQGLIHEHRIDALGHNCWTSIQSEYGICGCGVFSFLEDDGYPIACETDVYGAASLLLQKVIAKQFRQETRPFFMDWTIQHPKDPNLFQAWHCGKAPISVFTNKPAIRTHEILGPLLGEASCGGTMEGELRTGPVTLLRLTEYGGRFRAMITRGAIETSEWANMRGSWGWVRVRDLNGLYRCLIEKGFSHHVSLIHGDHAELTAATCRELEMEVVWVE